MTTDQAVITGAADHIRRIFISMAAYLDAETPTTRTEKA